MRKLQYLNREQGFYLFLMISALVATLGFGIFYWIAEVPELYIPTFGAFLLFLLFSALSYSEIKLVILFRVSILIVFAAFFNQVFFTGGVKSPGMLGLIIPQLLAFFYRPIRDRYIFMVISGICILVMWPLTAYGHSQDLLPASMHVNHAFLCAIFLFSIVTIYSFLFRSALITKNKKIGKSMKQLQDTTHKLIQSEKMASLGLLSAGVAHEINNPLNFIKGGIEVLEEELVKEPNLAFESEPCVHAIKEGLSRASVIVKSLNHFSRDTDSMDEVCDLNEILQNSLVMLQPRLKYKGKVIKELADDELVIHGNEGKLHQAFINIISNAEQAIERNGVITIKTQKNRWKYSVEITDNGVGISPNDLKKISDPFFTTKPVGQGTGLGLSITYKIIEDHGGHIEVSSKLGAGTTFLITFNAS